MNPTANKSGFEDLTTNLKDLAYSYLEKYSPSKQQLKVFLLKKYLTKIKGTQSKKEVSEIIVYLDFFGETTLGFLTCCRYFQVRE